jgi:hypothetical protein
VHASEFPASAPCADDESAENRVLGGLAKFKMTTWQLPVLFQGYVEREPNRIVSGEVLFCARKKWSFSTTYFYARYSFSTK